MVNASDHDPDPDHDPDHDPDPDTDHDHDRARDRDPDHDTDPDTDHDRDRCHPALNRAAFILFPLFPHRHHTIIFTNTARFIYLQEHYAASGMMEVTFPCLCIFPLPPPPCPEMPHQSAKHPRPAHSLFPVPVGVLLGAESEDASCTFEGFRREEFIARLAG